jgi:hypothetical protein
MRRSEVAPRSLVVGVAILAELDWCELIADTEFEGALDELISALRRRFACVEKRIDEARVMTDRNIADKIRWHHLIEINSYFCG